MSSLNRTQSQNYNQKVDLTTLQQQQQVDQNPPTVTNDPQPFTSKSDAQSRVARQEALQTIKDRPLRQREITVDNLISKDGLKFALGKATSYAKFKDTMMRAAFKVKSFNIKDFSTKEASNGTGSLHRSAIRLGDQYQKLTESGAPDSERLAVLKELRGKLDDMHTKLHGFNTDFDAIKDHPVTDMLKFVDATIASFPSEHLAAGTKMMTEGYAALKTKGEVGGVSIGDKIKFLEEAEDHLLTADAAGLLDENGKALLEECQKEIKALKDHAPFKKELSDFVANKDKNLKPVKHQVVSDFVGDLRAQMKRDQTTVDNFLQDDSWTQRESVFQDIQNFDRSNLNKVKTNEHTGLEHAQNKFLDDSFEDAMLNMEPGTPPQNKEGVVFDPSLTGFTKEDLNLDGLSKEASNAVRSGKSKELDKVAQELGTRLGRALSQQPHDVRLGFVSSHGEGVKQELLELLLADSDSPRKLVDKEGQPLPGTKALLDKAYSIALSNLPDHFVDENTIVVQGITYTKAEQLGSGSYGEVHLYKGQDNMGNEVSIAVKSSLPSVDGNEVGFKDLAQELRVHRSASLGNPKQIVGLKVGIQTMDGRILIAMESAPHGTLFEMRARLKDAVDKGLISPLAANLVRITLMKDVLLGMQHFQEGRGLTHLDVKSPNFLIGEGGVVKLADFGTGDTTLDRSLSERLVDNPSWLAPEFLIREDVRQANIPPSIKNTLKEAYEKAKNAGLSESDMESLRQDVIGYMDEHDAVTKQRQEDMPSIPLNEKADTWSAGITAYEIFFGELPFKDQFMFRVEQMLKDYAADPKSSISILGKDSDGQSVGTGATQVDRLINRMLHPIPEERPTISDLLKLSLFTEPGVGEPDVRDLIMLLSDKNATASQFKEASDKLGV